METPVDDVKAAVAAVTEEAPTKAESETPSRKRYSRAQLMHIRETIDLSAPPVGYNPATLRPADPMGKEMGPVARDGKNWGRTRSMGQWAAQNQGGAKGGNGGGGGGLPFGRMSSEATEEQLSGQQRGGRALRPTISWNEQQAAGAIPAPDKALGRRNSRSDAPGRWDNNKDEQLSKSAEKRGSEKWMSYGHRDSKDKPPKTEDECIENLSQEPYRGHEPEWMHHKPSAENTERMKQHRQFAADFEEERKLMRQRIAKDPKDRPGDRGENPMFMTDEQINEYKKELEAEERGTASSAFTFDTLKEALKSQGVSNLPPMPTTGISTVDQIEKTLKATATAQQQRPSMPDVERQKQLELLKAMSGGGASGNVTNPATAAGSNYEGANRLLSMLRGQNRPPVSFGNINSGAPLQQPMGAFPMNVPQQPGLFPSANTQLERLFAANPRMGANLGLMAQAAQQAPQMQPRMGNAQTLPFMQPGNQFAQRGGPPNPLLSALLVNPQQQQTAQQTQAQIMAHLHQAQQQTPLPTAAGTEAGLKAAQENAKDESGLLSGGGGSGPNPNPMSFPSFGLQGSFMGHRPAAPGMFNSPMANLQTGGNPQESLFPGGMPGSVNPAGVGGHPPALYMQNGGGLARPMAPGLSGLALTGMHPAMGGGLGPMVDDRQLPALNGAQPNALQATLLHGQQNNSGIGGSNSLNRFFVEQEVGGAGTFPSDQPAGAPVRNRSLEELKNEAQ